MSKYKEDAAAMLQNISLENIAAGYMDDDIREDLHFKMAPCTDVDFLAAYMEMHENKYGEVFTV